MTLAKVLRYAILHVGSSSMSITILEYKSIDDVQLIQSNENCCNVIMIDDYRNMFSLTKNLEETS